MDQFETWLIKNNIPEYITRYLLNKSFPFGKEIGSVRFFSPEIIMEENEFDLWANLLENKLFAIESAINGDPWVINYKQNHPSVAILPFDNMP